MARERVLVRSEDVEPVGFDGEGWEGVSLRVLSRDDETGALSGVVSIPGGYRRGVGHFTVETEYYVLSGAVRLGETAHEAGFYAHALPGTSCLPWVVETGCEMLFMARGGAPEFIPGKGSGDPNGQIEIDTHRMEWVTTTFPGRPPGACLKILREVEETGEAVFLHGNVPRWETPVMEYHDCAEELFLIEGDAWLGNIGLMTPGSYGWLPPYATHGPSYSHAGQLMFVWVESTIVSHEVDDPRRTPEENRRDSVRQGLPVSSQLRTTRPA